MRRTLLSFELSAIDLILVVSVIVLLLLYMTKFSKVEKKPENNLNIKQPKIEKSKTTYQLDSINCPRGFGNIKKMDSEGEICDRCLGCYKIMDCYTYSETVKSN